MQTPPSAAPGAGFAALVREALSADAALICTFSGDIIAWSASMGSTPDEAEIVSLFSGLPNPATAGGTRLDSVRDANHPVFLLRSAEGFSSAAAVPIQVEDSIVGLLAVYRVGGPGFDGSLLRRFARHAAIGVEIVRSTSELDAPQQRIASLEALEQLAITSTTVEELCSGLIKNVAPLFDASTMAVLVWNETSEVLELLEGSWGATAEALADCTLSTRNFSSSSARVFLTGVPYISNNAPGDEAVLWQFVHAFNLLNLINVPIHNGERVVGVLSIANKPTGFSLGDVQRLLAVSARVGTVLEYAWTMFKARVDARVEGALLTLAASIASGDSMEISTSVAVEQLRAALGLKLLAIVGIDTPSSIARSSDLDPRVEATVTLLPNDEERPTFSTGLPRRVGDPEWTDVKLPVRLGGRRVAVLVAVRPINRPFGAEELRTLQRLSGLAGLAYSAEGYRRQRAEIARREERHRLAADLHDDVLQLLQRAKKSLDQLDGSPTSAGTVWTHVEHARSLVDRADDAIRRLWRGQARPASPGLATSIEGACADIERDFDLIVEIYVSDEGRRLATGVSREHGQALVRVVRESLVNVAKHSGSDHATVTLDSDDSGRLALSVRDYGRGVDLLRSPAGHGIASLRKIVEALGGHYSLGRNDPNGVRVVVTLG